MEKTLNVLEASKFFEIQPQSIKIAIKKKKIIAKKIKGKWIISESEVQEYAKRKYNKSFSTYKGKPLLDEKKQELSVKKCCEIMGCSKNHLYYALRKKKLNSKRKGAAWIITFYDLAEYMAFVGNICIPKKKIINGKPKI